MDAKHGMKRLRDERRARGICIGCGLEKPKENCVMCSACLLRWKGYNSKYAENHPEKVREAAARRRKRLKAERLAKGVCTICGKNKPYAWRKNCNVCLQKRNMQRIKRELNKTKAAGGE